MLASTGECAADRRGQISWAMVEFARNPYLTLILIFVFPPYFANVVVGDPVRGQEIWGLTNTMVSMLIGMLPAIAPAERIGSLSGLGLSLNNTGTAGTQSRCRATRRVVAAGLHCAVHVMDPRPRSDAHRAAASGQGRDPGLVLMHWVREERAPDIVTT